VQDYSDPQTLNRYSYVRNNPLLYTDPSGHWFGIDDLVASVVGAIVGATQAAINGDNIFKGAAIGAAAGWVAWNTFGTTTGFLANSIVGTTQAAYVANGGLFWMAQMGGGIAAGAAGGATSSMLYGGDVGQGALTGGIVGGLGSFGFPNYSPFGESEAGSIGNRLFNNGLTGGAFGAAYAGVSGGDIWQGTKHGAMIWGLGEVANIGIGHGLGYAMSEGNSKFENGVRYYYAKGQRPFSVGGAVIGDEAWIKEANLHELAHATGKQKNLGPAYLPAHILSQGFSGIIGVLGGNNFWLSTHNYNIFERWWIEVPAN